MKIYGNWALGVTALYGSFALFIIGFFVVSTFNKVDLVEENYYDKEIAYQQHIDKVKRAEALVSPLGWKRQANQLVLQFPKNLTKIRGSINLYRPSDSKNDRTILIHPDDENVQYVPLSDMEKGLWRVKFNWQSDSTGYYNEDILFIE
ncbi:FixH family protein [bacterium]|nr:FixH family protein [bacterium]